MSDSNAQAVLDRILNGLNSENEARKSAAIEELTATNFSSAAILKRLEELAINGTGDVKESALKALNLKTSQLVSSRISTIPQDDRRLILREIRNWEKDRLIENQHAEVISRRYDFDIKAGIAVSTAAKTSSETQAEIKTSQPVAPAPSKPETPEPMTQPRAAEPRPSLMQMLLSETSIRIYLYLGAFFVIAAAAILAALVEAARLPVLLAATVAFTAGAVGFKRRLPQPSFAFGIVSSFLLPIDASVIADLLRLAPRSNDAYWSVVFVGMAIVWVFGTRFYESRLFSLASFLAFAFGAIRLVQAFSGSTDWVASAMGFSGLVGLLGARSLIKWRDQNFATPLFLASQALQGVTLLVSGTMITANLFDSNLAADSWIAHTLTWLFAASFFAASDLLASFFLFPWISAASLFLIPWLFLSIFDASAPVMIAGFGLWGTLIALSSYIAQRVQHKQINNYHYPLLALSLLLFSVAMLWGLIEGVEYAFAAFLLTAVVYTIIHAMQPRWYVWTTALLAGLGAFFAFFALPFMERANVYIGYQLLLASVLLLLPELFFKQALTITRSWNWPPVALGVVVIGFNILIAHIYLIEGDLYFSRAAIILGVYALLFAAYAFRFKLPQLGYPATSSLALTVVYALTFFDLDLWLPALTVLTAIYYFEGYLLARREETKSWSAMLVHSGLVLGAIISLVALLSLKAGGGWYTIIISALFVIEMFTRRNGYLEVFAVSLLNAALIILLNDFKVHELAYYFFGLSLVWLVSDAILKLTYKDRRIHLITWFVSGVLTVSAVGAILVTSLASAPAAICFAVYAAFFAAYAFIYKMPVLGYLSTAGVTATMFYALDHFNIEAWLPIFTGLTLAYYFVGFLLRKKSAGWSTMLRYSGLALGSLLSLIALVNLESGGGWYALIVGVLFVAETVSSRNGVSEAGVHILFSVAAFLLLRDLHIREFSYILLALSIVWLGGDVIFEKTFKERKVARHVQVTGAGIALLNALLLLFSPNIEAAICFGVYALFFAAYAWLYQKPLLGYASTASLSLAITFGYGAAGWTGRVFGLIGIAVLYYAGSVVLRKQIQAKGWGEMFLFSGLGLGVLVTFASLLEPGGAENALPIAIAATLFAAEAYARRNVQLAFPANGLYLVSYFILLVKLNVNQPQYFSIGAALLGLLMHYLLMRAKSKSGAFLMGMVSQLVLLGTTYIQMLSTEELGFFLVLFAQSLVILVYGIVMRSRSLVIAPIAFAVLGTLTVVYSALKDLSVVVIVGVTGIVLLVLGVLAVLMRERITTLAERFGEWDA